MLDSLFWQFIICEVSSDKFTFTTSNAVVVAQQVNQVLRKLI